MANRPDPAWWDDLANEVADELDLSADDRIPTPADVVDALTAAWMEPYRAQYHGRIGELLQTGHEWVLDGRLPDPDEKEGALLMWAASLAEPTPYLEKMQREFPDDFRATVLTAWHSLHALFELIDNTGLKHPLAALIEGWLKRPVPAVRNRKAASIITNQHFLIREFTPSDTSLGEVGVGQAMLPGLEALLPDYDEMEKFPVLAMFDALRGSDKEAGLGLRLLVTVLAEIDALESIPIGDSGVLVPMILRTIFGHLWPRGMPRGKHRLRAMQRLRTAMLGWNYTGIPDRGGLRRVIGTVGEWITLPDDYPLDGEVTFQVYLPPGATKGALIHRETMDYLGVTSGLMYRAMLTLAHQWWRAAHTKGKDKDGITRGTTWPYATRPVRLKDETDNPIIRNGRTVPGVPNGERETNPMIQYLPTYTDDRLLRLCYSPTQITSAERSDNLHKYRSRARTAAQEMGRLGLLEMAHFSGGLKLCPPSGWGVNFQMPEAVKRLGKRRKSV